MKKKLTIILLFVLLIIDIFLIIFFSHELISRNDYTNSIYVVTSSQGYTKFYEINEKGNRREVSRFKYEYNNVYYPKGCIESYIDNNKVLNRFTPESCEIVDYDNNVLSDDTLIHIVKEIAKLKHDLMKIRIFKTKNNYYVNVEYNVNWFSPYELFKYENGKLKKITRLENEEILFIKE